MKKLFSASLVFLMVLGMVGMALIPVAKGSIGLNYEPVDKGPYIRDSNVPIDFSTLPTSFSGSAEGSSLKVAQVVSTPYYEVGDVIYWLALDDYYGYYFFAPFQLRGISNNCEVWVQLDLSWTEGDPREHPVVTDEMVNYILEEFDDVIYPTDTLYFGVPDEHNGTYSLLDAWGYVPPGYYGGSSRNVILIENVRDENYYNPDYPYYIAGFYSPAFEAYMDRNIITIDCYDWIHRLGPEGHEWVPGDYVTRPYLYESVVAHEYQHLIHDDYNPDDDTFMNEGCSMYAEVLCGYPIDWNAINSYLYTPDNSLVDWGDQGDINILADYGAALLWTVYLSDHYGGADFIRYFVQSGVPGIEGINLALAHFGYSETFDDVFRDWRIANLIHSDVPGRGRYNYVTIDLGGAEAVEPRVYEVKATYPELVPPTKGTDFGTTVTILGYDTGISTLGAYGSDYVRIDGLKASWVPKLVFDGDDEAGPRWVREDMDGDGDLEWYSTTGGSLADLSIVAELNLPEGNVVLSFDTYFEIEDYWDFGFVQISLDGENWTSLENSNTTYVHDPNAHPTIVENLPGLTGSSEGWVREEFNLTEHSGKSVFLRFRYVTDWAVQYAGWWVDNIAINGEVVDDADENVVFSPLLEEADFIVTVIRVIEVRIGWLDLDGWDFMWEGRFRTTGVGLDFSGHSKKVTVYIVEDVKLDDSTEYGTERLLKFVGRFSYVLLVVSCKQGYSDYVFSVVSG
ncbi:MAG: peptidase M6 [Candidatus Asgardarchaeia archaeon]